MSRKEIKLELLNLAGGPRCSKCGYDKCIAALTFHHLDETKKKFNISQMIGKLSVEELRKEIKGNTIVLCCNCHTELHYNN